MHSQEGCAHFAADAAIGQSFRARPAWICRRLPVGAIYASTSSGYKPGRNRCSLLALGVRGLGSMGGLVA